MLRISLEIWPRFKLPMCSSIRDKGYINSADTMGLYEDQTSPIHDYVTLPYINTSVFYQSGAKYCPKNTVGRKEKRGRGWR